MQEWKSERIELQNRDLFDVDHNYDHTESAILLMLSSMHKTKGNNVQHKKDSILRKDLTASINMK